MDTINARFLAGGPANNLASAGVLVRTFDDITDPTKPWLPCPPNFHGCFKYAGLFSVSILWPRHTGIYDTGRGGLVLRGERLRTLCFYAGDGTTMSKVSEQGGGALSFATSPAPSRGAARSHRAACARVWRRRAATRTTSSSSARRSGCTSSPRPWRPSAPFPAYCVFGRAFEHTNSDFQWNAARGAARA